MALELRPVPEAGTSDQLRSIPAKTSGKATATHNGHCETCASSAGWKVYCQAILRPSCNGRQMVKLCLCATSCQLGNNDAALQCELPSGVPLFGVCEQSHAALNGMAEMNRCKVPMHPVGDRGLSGDCEGGAARKSLNLVSLRLHAAGTGISSSSSCIGLQSQANTTSSCRAFSVLPLCGAEPSWLVGPNSGLSTEVMVGEL